jgi:signal transduction histidine kinase
MTVYDKAGNHASKDALNALRAQTKTLFKRLVSVQEDERRRIARDLHDDLGQLLTALRMNLEVFRLQCDLDPARLAQLERTQQLADGLDERVDFLIWGLWPPVLEHRGLVPALTEFVKVWSDRFGVCAHFHSTLGNVRLDRDVENNLYRVTQEALTNIAKHAHATQVSVLLDRRGSVLSLMIEDDGRGFDITAVDGSSRFGLISMRERAALIGAELLIESTVGRGTTTVLRMPTDA